MEIDIAEVLSEIERRYPLVVEIAVLTVQNRRLQLELSAERETATESVVE